MKKWIDTHAHYNHGKFNRNRKELLTQLPEYVEAVIQVGTNTKSNTETLQLVSLYDYIYGIIGFFPTDVWQLENSLCSEAENNWLVFTKQLTNQKVVAIGEIGLDYNWNKVGDVIGEEAREIQQKWFRRQLDLAQEMKLPVCIHSRDAKEDTLAILNEYETVSGVIHCFSYDRETAQKCLEKGLYLAFGGTSTYLSNEELREVIKMTPMNRILLETDAPYLSPSKVRKELNTSKNIQYVIELIAELKGLSFDEVVEQTNENVKRLFPALRRE